MKRSKKLYTLLGVLAVILLATVGVLQYEEKQEEIKNSGEIILQVQKDEVTGLSWKTNDNELSFHLNDTWTYDGDEAFPVDEEKLLALLAPLEELEAGFTIENVEDYGQYGLDDPECTIIVETKDKTYTITLGEFSSMDSQRYVSLDDGNAYLVTEDPADTFDVALSDLIKHDEVPEMEVVNQLTIKGDSGNTSSYTITRQDSSTTYSEDDLYYTKLEDETLPLDPENVEEFLSSVTGLSLTDYVTYSATEDDLAKYYLDQPNLTLEITYEKEKENDEEVTVTDTFLLSVGWDEEKATELEADEEMEAYVRVGDSPIIYQITTSEYESLIACTYHDLRHQELFWGDFGNVSQVDISLEGETYTFTSDGKEEDQVWIYKEEEIELADVRTGIKTISVSEFTESDDKGKEEIRVTIKQNSENDPEVTIRLYRYDGTYCLAIVDGETIGLVERSQVVELIEAVNAVVL